MASKASELWENCTRPLRRIAFHHDILFCIFPGAILLLTGYLLASQTLAQTYNSWHHEPQRALTFDQRPELGPRSLSNSGWQNKLPNNPQNNPQNSPQNNPPNNQEAQPLDYVEEVVMNKREPTTPPPPNRPPPAFS